MQTTKTRIAVVSAATLALALLGSSAVAAQGGPGGDLSGDLARHQWGGRGDDGMPGGMMGSGMHGILGDDADGFIRRDVTYETDAGIVTDRTDQGTVSGVADATLEYTLASGETATVTTDADTEIISLTSETVESNSGRTRTRLQSDTVALADVPVGAEVVVSSESQADGTFLADRIVIRPAATDVAASGDTSTDDSTSVDDSGSQAVESPAASAAADA
jgi:hypothetical protein